MQNLSRAHIYTPSVACWATENLRQTRHQDFRILEVYTVVCLCTL